MLGEMLRLPIKIPMM